MESRDPTVKAPSMLLGRTLILTACLLAAAAGGASALDPSRKDILTFRAGVTEAETAARLTGQGARWSFATPFQPQRSIQALMKDGGTAVAFSGAGRIDRIDFVVTGRGMNEDTAVRGVVIEYHGGPSTDPRRQGAAYRDRPSGRPLLTFTARNGVRAVLTFTSGG